MRASVTHKSLDMNEASKVVQHERVYDHVYDPVYTVSSERDHNRVNFRALALRNRVRRVYDYGSLFSDCPSYTVKLDPAQPLPAVADSQWRGHAEQRQETLRWQLAGVIPSVQSGIQITDTQINQAEILKYYKRPIISFPQQHPSNMVLSLPRENLTSTEKRDDSEPSHFTVGVQTDYRESETQTDPYSPAYLLPPERTPPELLQLAILTWGHGLPAGIEEVKMIERMRAKLAWEATLPSLNDLSQLDKRRQMMEKMEAKEWAFREGEIQELQDARLAVLKDLLKQRDEAHRETTSQRLNLIGLKHQNAIENKKKKIQSDYMRELRKLETKRKNVGANLEWRGLRPDSQDYVPRIRKDVISKMDTSSTSRSIYLDTHKGLLELQAGLDGSTLNSNQKKGTKSLRLSPVNKSLERLQTYKALKEEEKKEEKPLRFLVKKEKPEPRPPTPKVEKPPEGEEEKELAVILLQSLLRGRSIQYKMAKDKKNHYDLIQEQRAVLTLQNQEHQLQKADVDESVSQEEACLAGAVGAELNQIFDALSKELIRLQEERRIHAFMLLAERDRRLREAEESGRRQVEERRRREEDEIFKHVVRVHQESVDLYLEDIILVALGEKADQQAREEIHRWAKEVNDIAYAMEESRDGHDSEEIVSELIYSFLIPEVERINVQQRVQKKELKHLQAARSIIYGTAGDSGTEAQDTQSGTHDHQD